MQLNIIILILGYREKIKLPSHSNV